MPLYDYLCKKCAHRFEKIQKFSDPEIKECPQCGGEVERLLSAPAVQFKGTGWYVTDYPKKSVSPSSGSSGSSEKTGTSSTSDSTQTSAKKADSSPAKSDGKS